MGNIDRRISYRIVLDTETCPIDNTQTTVSPYNMLVYDIGWAVVDKKGKVYRTRSFVVDEIYNGEAEKMKSGYYASKLPQYEIDIQNGSRVLDTFYNIRQTLLADITEFEVTEIYAHNMFFDYGSLSKTMSWVTKGKYRYYFPLKIQLCDTLAMARSVISKTPTYKNFCHNNGYMTKSNQVQLKAEVLYKYMTGDNSFVESHTGLEDVMIEKDIMKYCFAKHKSMNRFFTPKT